MTFFGPAPPRVPVPAARGRARGGCRATKHGGAVRGRLQPPPPAVLDRAPPPPPKLPAPRPPTPFIANDRGHLLPHVRRSQVSPWGTFLGTWDMPARIPPARLDLSARQPRAAARLARERPPGLSTACNGLRTRVTGKLQKPWDTEPSGKEQGVPAGALWPQTLGTTLRGDPVPKIPLGGDPVPKIPLGGDPVPKIPPAPGPPPAPEPLEVALLSLSPPLGTIPPPPPNPIFSSPQGGSGGSGPPHQKKGGNKGWEMQEILGMSPNPCGV
ncbi:protein Flattop [Vidua chalybeata]|uniref:protein Flattop n=1 Tax=Vidua chalybeata TaxID=81927 RepID=UPI0023A81F38|nr:protein Flattop [Vidua chalybeata]